MYRIKGLEKYIESEKFKKGIGIKNDENIEPYLLAQGEYNINYVFNHPIKCKKFILRVNTKSQMNLDNQIEYEYEALKRLAESGRTPEVYYVDGSLEDIGFGVLVMEFLEGEPLDYIRDLKSAANCLADIHSLDVNKFDNLIKPKDFLGAIIDECEAMSKVYIESSIGITEVKNIIKRLISISRDKVKDKSNSLSRTCPINTELNSGNFLINRNGKDYIIDWEKPIIGEYAQDLGHFLAPTTTFWKTDNILNKEDIEYFVKEYRNAVNNRFSTENLEERLEIYIILTCLRGITWCSMAYIDYQSPDKVIKNEFTYNKIKNYLEIEFLKLIEEEYFRG